MAGGRRVSDLRRDERCCPIRLAKLSGGLDQRIEHRLQIERRAADDLEHVGGRGLLLQRFAEIAVRACTSSNSRTFSIAITAWSAKVVSSSICLSVNGRTALRCKDDDANRRRLRSSGTPSTVRTARHSRGKCEFRVSEHIRHMDGLDLRRIARPTPSPRPGDDWMSCMAVQCSAAMPYFATER